MEDHHEGAEVMTTQLDAILHDISVLPRQRSDKFRVRSISLVKTITADNLEAQAYGISLCRDAEVTTRYVRSWMRDVARRLITD